VPAFTPRQKADARQMFRDGKGCTFCGGFHLRACPRVSKAGSTYSPGGDHVTATTVEYWPPGTWETGILWPEDAFDDDEDGDS
jgi:hypothetical protein